MDLDKNNSAHLEDQITHNDSNTHHSFDKTYSDDNISGSKTVNISEENYIKVTNESDKVNESENTDNLKSVDISLISDPDIKELTEGNNLQNSPDKSPVSPEPIPPKRHQKQKPPEIPEKPKYITGNFEDINTEDLKAKISLSLENQQNPKVGKMENDTKEDYDNSNKILENEYENVTSEVQHRPQKCEAHKGQNRMSFMMKTKGQLFYKKKGAFSKWKEHFTILDESKLQMNFFKSQEDYEKLSRCKVSVDLRFVTEIKPIKPRFLQSSFPFKMQRRAGLSTVKLAAHNEEERAKWITMIESIMEKGKIMSDLHSIAEEKRSSTLPNRLNESMRTSTDSETHTTASAPDNEELIRPKKVSSSTGFKLDSHQITSVKLKRVSSEVSEQRSPIKKAKEEEEEEVFDPKEKFGVQLRRVQTEKSASRSEREQSPEYIEFKEKYNSLSLSRKNKIPKLPLNENSTCSHLVVNISREEEGESGSTNIITNSPSREIKTLDPVQLGKESKDPKETNRKRSPSPNIPISKGVEAVMKNKSTEEPEESSPNLSKPKLSICHATSTVISYYESSDLNIDENVNNPKDKGKVKQPDIVSSSTVVENNGKDTITTTSSITTATKPDIVKSSHVNIVETMEDPNDKGLETELLVKTEKVYIDDAENSSAHKDTKLTTIKSSDESIPTHTEVIHTETNDESYTLVSEQPIIIHTSEIDTEDDNEHNDIKFITVKSSDEINPSHTEIKPTQIDTQSSSELSGNAEVEEHHSSANNFAKTEENLIINNEHVKAEVIIPVVNDNTNKEAEHFLTELRKSSWDEKDETSKETTEIKRHSKPVKGIMTQSQIDSIVFGGEYKPPDADNELMVPGKLNEEGRLSFLSFQSQVSTESDEPLPRFNFLGKGDRSSTDSASMRGSLIVEESKDIKISEPDTSLEQLPGLEDSSLKSQNTRDKDNLKDSETRSSLVLPQFTVVEESVEEYSSEEKTPLEDKVKLSLEYEEKTPLENEEKIPLEGEDKTPLEEGKPPPENEEKTPVEDEEKISHKDTEESVIESEKSVLRENEVSLSKENKEQEQSSMIFVLDEPNERNIVIKYEEIQEATFEYTPSLIAENNAKEGNEYQKETKNINLDISDSVKETEYEIECIENSSGISSLSSGKDETEKNPQVDKELKVNLENLALQEEFPVIQNRDIETQQKSKVDIIVHQESQSSQSDGVQIITLSSKSIYDYDNKTNSNYNNNKLIDNDDCIDSNNTQKETKLSTKQTINSLSEENSKILKEIEFEETEDYFPTFGSVEYRIKGQEYLEIEDASIRTSGIQGLKEFLKENDTESSEQEYKSGISRLGHSPAIEKLRKETP